MFERYTEKARRVIFFARYEASEFGAPCIETEHILLGLLKEDDALTHRFLPSIKSTDSVRRKVQAVTPVRPKISTSVDLPLSHESKRVLDYAAEEADRLNHKHLGTEHLLLALLREEKGLAATLLRERGLALDRVRQELITHGTDSSTSLGELLRSTVLAYLESHTNDLSIFLGGSGIYVKPDRSTEMPAYLYIEILSPTERLRDLRRRIDDHFSRGLLYFWLFDPGTRHVYVATPETGLQEFKGDVLRTEDPALELPLAEVFS
jgi:Clp amino terminal domain, pathogenicity island component/Putative restriction endonuclease